MLGGATGGSQGDGTLNATGLYINGSQVGYVVQTVRTTDGDVATGSTVLPFDDTTPQNTEGDEVMTRSITPSDSNNTLLIIAVAYAATAQDGIATGAALFQDSTADALASGYQNANAGSNPFMVPIVIIHHMTAGTASSTTFKIRVGSSSGTTTFNGDSGTQKYNSTIASSITILEIAT